MMMNNNKKQRGASTRRFSVACLVYASFSCLAIVRLIRVRNNAIEMSSRHLSAKQTSSNTRSTKTVEVVVYNMGAQYASTSTTAPSSPSPTAMISRTAEPTTASPTLSPTALPTSSPTTLPTPSPTELPTSSPTAHPTSTPTTLPTKHATQSTLTTTNAVHPPPMTEERNNMELSSLSNTINELSSMMSSTDTESRANADDDVEQQNQQQQQQEDETANHQLSATADTNNDPTTTEDTPAVEESSSSLPIVEAFDCQTLAPCHLRDEDTELSPKCTMFYPKRFWDSSLPTDAMREHLHQQHNNMPPNCWYESEILIYHKLDNATNVPYKTAVCNKDVQQFPETIVFWHNFKVAGTTARIALGHKFPNYYSGQHVFSNRLKILFGEDLNPATVTNDYVAYADQTKQSIYDQQQQQLVDPNEASSPRILTFTFVRSPVQRFLSGLEQIERLNNTGWEVSAEAQHCFEDATILDPQNKVQCIVDTIYATNNFFNVHIFPQAYLFDAWTKRGVLDMAIVVLDLKDMDPLLRRFKGKTVKRVRASTQNNTKLQLVDRNLESSLLYKICQLYEIDLQMLRVMGMEDPLCASVMTTSSSSSTTVAA